MTFTGPKPETFAQFSVQPRSFERVLTCLVASSFVLSGVAAFARAAELDPTQIATITLIGTLAGSTGTLITYLEWPHRPDEEYVHTVMFDVAQITGRVRVSLFVSLIAILLFAAVPNVDAATQIVILLSGSAGIYFFYRGVVTAALAARQIDAQQSLWIRIGQEGRVGWIAFREGQVQRGAQRAAKEHENLRRMREKAAELDLSRQEMTSILKRSRQKSCKRPMANFWDASGRHILRASVGLRRWISGDRLLAPASARDDVNY